MPVQHQDFGEKIGGAKKDLWRKRGLHADDLDAMNEREAEKYVTKEYVWKKPDYQAMVDGGIPADVVFFIKKVRDSLIAAPQYNRVYDTPEKRLARQKEYVETVREAQSVVGSVRTREDALAACSRFLVEGGYIERMYGGIAGSPYCLTDKGQKNPVITKKLFRVLHVQSVSAFERDFTKQALREQFGVPKSEKVPKGYEIQYNDGKHTWSKDNDWQTNTYYVTKGYNILKTNFPDRESALKWVQELAKQRGGTGKKRFVPKQLENIRREGPDYRRGRDVEGTDYLNTFGFRGGEFGNWLNQNDRQASLNMGFDALKDLAATLKISDHDISFGGALSIAFGARGGGNAAAHYEPLRKVINLTKMHGAGALAHEWWHALDDYLGGKFGAVKYLSENPRGYPLMQKLIDTIKYKKETPEQAAQNQAAQDSRLRGNAESWLDSTMLSSLAKNEDAMAKYQQLKTAFLSGEPDALDKLNRLKKAVTGHVIPKSRRDILAAFERILPAESAQTEPVLRRIETDYYRDSMRMGRESMKDGDYWDSNVEMTARAFACYLYDRLDGRSDYLAGHAESAVTLIADKEGNLDILRAYPQGAERAAINAVFDEMIQDLKLQHHLTHADKPPPLQEPPRKEAAADRDDRPVIACEQLTFGEPAKLSVRERLAEAKKDAMRPAAPGPPQKERGPAR